MALISYREPVVLYQINCLSRTIWLKSAGVVKGGMCNLYSEIPVLEGRPSICALDIRGKERLNYLVGFLSIGSGT